MKISEDYKQNDIFLLWSSKQENSTICYSLRSMCIGVWWLSCSLWRALCLRQCLISSDQQRSLSGILRCHQPFVNYPGLLVKTWEKSWRMGVDLLGGWNTGILICLASPHRAIKSLLKVSLVYPYLDLRPAHFLLKLHQGWQWLWVYCNLWRDLCCPELISSRFLCVPRPLMVSKQTMTL